MQTWEGDHRLVAGRQDTIALVSAFFFLSTTNNANYKYKILLNTSLTAPTWVLSDTGNIETSITETGLSGGIVLDSGFINSAVKGTALNMSVDDPFRFQLGRTLAGVSDILTLAVTSDTTSSVVGLVNWTEYT